MDTRGILNSYHGKNENVPSTVSSVVNRLLSELHNKGYTLYLDRFYSSPTLFDELLANGTAAVGTVQSNRKGMPQTFKQKIDVGEMIHKRRFGVLALKWRDRRDVFMLTTKHKAVKTTVPSKKPGAPPKHKPVAVVDYNKNKVGVDRGDQLLSYYPFQRKSLKWWKKVFFHLFITAIVNSFLLYRKVKNDTKPMPLVKYMETIAEDLALQGGAPEGGEHRMTNEAGRLTGRHFPVHIPPTPKREKPTRVCHVCSEKAKRVTGKAARKETSYYCADCGVSLCVTPCFQIFHTKKHYSA